MKEDAARAQPVVSGSQVMAAGLASTVAAFVTSKFGVAGTLLGAGLTAMIITGGSAVLKAYLESMTGTVRKIRGRKGRAAPFEARETPPGRPDLRNNFVGRLRAAFGWFSHISPLSRRSILLKGLVGGVVAFVIGMGIVTAVEAGVLGGSLSCKIWKDCSAGATSSVTGGTTGTAGTTGSSGTSTIGRLLGGGGSSQDTQTVDPSSGQPPDPNAVQPPDPNAVQPSDSANPQTPAEPGTPVEPTPQEPVTPTPTPEEPAQQQQPSPSGVTPQPAPSSGQQATPSAQPAAPAE